MARARQHGRPDSENRRTPTVGDLHSLERMRAPWFFEAEVQRRLRTGDRGRHPARGRNVTIITVSAVLVVCFVACLAVAYLQFADRVSDLLPASVPPVVTLPDTIPILRADTARIVRPESVAVALRVAQRAEARRTNDTLRTVGDTTISIDSTPRPSPARVPALQESTHTDTALRREPPPAGVPADTSLTPPDSLTRRQGAP